ncbi:MAG: hypothetical protein A2096_08835 [Spirochaetes bacterium GWF1_41_5]|nr:MAG: hypothetical protein A2096_08835 [Spirochaetes bacterium GWF1_41_5]HBE01125.1 hypothetical protein [Spirochaetia bacterium]
MKDKMPVKVIKKAFDLLEQVIVASMFDKISSLSILASELKIPRNTARNILKTMIQCGYIDQDKNQKYIPGNKCRQISLLNTIFSPLVIENSIKPLMDQLGDILGETCIYVGLICGRRIPLYCTDSNEIISVNLKKLNDNFYFRATGRILCAFAGTEELKSIVETNGMPGAAWNNINDIKSLHSEIKKLRTSGICLTENKAAGLRSFALPVLSDKGVLMGSIGCYLAAFKYNKKKSEKIIYEMKKFKIKIEKELSCYS